MAMKVMKRHVRKSDQEQINQNRLSEWDQRVCEQRHKKVEHSFSDAKQLLGHCYALIRSLSQVQAKYLLATAWGYPIGWRAY